MRILIVDDHPLYLEAARASLERNIADCEIVLARSLTQAMEILGGPGVFELVLVDYFLPEAKGDESVSQIRQSSPQSHVVVMSGNAGRSEVSACIAAGAKGFLPKTLEAEMFATAVKMVLMGATYVPAEFASLQHIPAVAANTQPWGLTLREDQVLEMIVGGASNKEIARALDLQEVTVKLHVNRIFHKLGVKNRSQAAVKAVEEKLVRR